MAITYADGSQTATLTTEHPLSAPNAIGQFRLEVDLNAMASGDVTEIRAYKMVRTGGTSRPIWVVRFTDAQPTDAKVVRFEPVDNDITDTDAIKFTLLQTVGTGRAYPWAVLQTLDALAPATVGRKVVVDDSGLVDANTVKVGATGAGTAQTARDIGASVLLSSGTGTGQVSLSSGAVLLQATQTGVTIPTVTNLTNAPGAGDFTATMKTSLNAATPASVTGAVGSVTGAVGSVTGAVGSVTGNVGGNVTGTVGSVVGAVGSVTGAVGSVTGNVGGNVTGSVGSVVGNTAQTGDSYARLGAPAGASVSADVAATKALLPTALTSDGNIKADILAINGNVLHAVLFSIAAGTMRDGVIVTDGGNSTTVFKTDLVSTEDDNFVGRAVVFANGNISGQAGVVSAYDGTNKIVTLELALTQIPADGDAFIIV